MHDFNTRNTPHPDLTKYTSQQAIFVNGVSLLVQGRSLRYDVRLPVVAVSSYP